MSPVDGVLTVGYITPTIYSSYHRLLLAGVQQATHARGARLLVFQMTTNDASRNISCWGGVDGWVISYSHLNTEAFIDTDHARPVVMVSEIIAGRPTVVIDNVGGKRAQQIITTLLHTIEQEHTSQILLDVSGVPLIDTQVAGMLLRLAQMVRMLGANTMLIGVRPEIAQSIVSLGVDLSSITAHSSLTSALESLDQSIRK